VTNKALTVTSIIDPKSNMMQIQVFDTVDLAEQHVLVTYHYVVAVEFHSLVEVWVDSGLRRGLNLWLLSQLQPLSAHLMSNSQRADTTFRLYSLCGGWLSIPHPVLYANLLCTLADVVYCVLLVGVAVTDSCPSARSPSVESSRGH